MRNILLLIFTFFVSKSTLPQDLQGNDQDHQTRNIKQLPPVNLINLSNNKISFQDILFKENTTITVIDFWASWCGPCIADYPHLKKIEKLFKGKSIKFISISIDLEEDADKWISRTKQLKTYNDPYQFRLQDWKNSGVNEFFNLVMIPRYIVIDKTGKILSEDFDRPNERGFRRKLEGYLRNSE